MASKKSGTEGSLLAYIRIVSETTVALCLLLLIPSLVATPIVALPSPLTASDHFALSISTEPPYSSYSGADPIVIGGTLSPPPSTNSNVTITISNPNGALVASAFAPVSYGPSGGSYSHTFLAGGSCQWTSGTYGVTGFWSNPIGAAIAEAKVNFTYFSANAPCPSSTTTSTPEFGSQALLVVTAVAMLATAFLVRRVLPPTKANPGAPLGSTLGRPARTSKRIAIVGIIVLLLVGLPILAHFEGWPFGSSSVSSLETSISANSSISSSRNSSTSAMTSSSFGGLIITNMFVDVPSSDEQALYSNSSSVSGKTTFSGSPGETFTVTIDVVYQACGAGACPKQVTGIGSATPGFAIIATTPSLPLLMTGAGGDFLEAGFTVEVMAPTTPYTGALTLVIQA